MLIIDLHPLYAFSKISLLPSKILIYLIVGKLLFLLLKILNFLFGIVILKSDEHSSKAFSPISVTLLEIITSVSDEQFLKAFLPISVTPFGISIFVSDEHPSKAFSPISVTLFGITIFVSDRHPENV